MATLPKSHLFCGFPGTFLRVIRYSFDIINNRAAGPEKVLEEQTMFTKLSSYFIRIISALAAAAVMAVSLPHPTMAAAVPTITILSVKAGESVTIKATRINALEAGKAVQCSHPVHTHWFVVRSGGHFKDPSYKRIEEFHDEGLLFEGGSAPVEISRRSKATRSPPATTTSRVAGSIPLTRVDGRRSIRCSSSRGRTRPRSRRR